MTTSDALLILFAAITGGIATFVTAYFTGFSNYIKAYWKIKEQDLIQHNTAKGLRSFGNWAYAIQMLQKLEFVDRVIIFCGQNGGGIPKIGFPYTIRGDYAWSRDSNEDLFVKYNFKLKIDSAYYYMLADVIEKKVVVNTTKDMDDTSVLKAMYSQEGVISSALYFIHIHTDENLFYYISIASKKQEFTKVQLNMIEPAVQRLRSMYTEADYN